MTDKKTSGLVIRYTKNIPSSLMLQQSGKEIAEYISQRTILDEEGRIIEEYHYDSNGQNSEIHMNSYSSGGKLVIASLSFPLDQVEESYRNTYDDSGQLIEQVKWYGDEEGERTIFSYHSPTKPSRIHYFDSDGESERVEILSYDEAGRLSEQRTEGRDGLEDKVILSYPDSKHRIEEHFDQDSRLLHRYEIEMDEQGNERSLLQFNSEGRRVARILSEYNEEGRLVKRESKSSQTRILSITYDEIGRKTEELLMDENAFIISRHHWEFDEAGLLSTETIYEADLNRTGRDTHLQHRFEFTDYKKQE